MLAVIGKLLPLARSFSRQIVPPVLATLIAALLIAGFNRAFSSHLVQPRMSAMHRAQGETRPIVYAANPQAEVAVTEVATSEPTVPERVFAKDNAGEAGKDQGTQKVAAAPAAPVPVPAPRARKSESVEQRGASVPVVAAPPVAPQHVAPVVQAPIAAPLPPVAAYPVMPPQSVAPQAGAPAAPATTGAPLPPVAAHPVMQSQSVAPQPGATATSAPMGAPLPPVAAVPAPQPVAPRYVAPVTPAPIGAPAPVAAQSVAAEPPPVITARPMVTVPDRPRPYPGYEERPPYAQAEDVAPPRADRPLERFVDALKPSSIFNRMREFGDRIEAAGNEILPTIRQ